MRGGLAALSAHLVLNLQSLKAPELKERLEESEKLIQEMTVTWEEKLRKTEEVAQVTHAAGRLVLTAWFQFSVCVAGDERWLFLPVFVGASEAVGEFRHLSAVFRDQSWRR